MKKTVIIGTGLAGYSLARELRKLDPDTELTLFSADDGAFYSKPMLSNAFAQNKTPQTLVNFRAEQMASQLNATIRTHTTVTKLSTSERIVYWDGGEQHYDQLVLAVGARQIPLPASGDALGSVLTVNSLTDYGRFREALGSTAEIALIGGGLIGCEFANDLLRGNYAVTLIHLGHTLLDSLVPAEVGQQLQQKLEEAGATVITDTSASSLNHADNAHISVALRNGQTVAVRRVLSAIGLRPATELAAAAGLRCGKGIVTDSYLETSAAGVYALGDCAEVNGSWLPYVMPIMNQARSLAKTLAGDKTAVVYPIMPVVVKTPAYPVVAVPPTTASGNWQIERQDDGVRALFLDENQRLRGFALGGRCTAEKASLVKALAS